MLSTSCKLLSYIRRVAWHYPFKFIGIDQMNSTSEAKASKKRRKPAELNSPALPILLALPDGQAIGIPADCPKRTDSRIVDIKNGIAVPAATPTLGITPLLANSCCSCPIIARCYPQEQWQRWLVEMGPRLMVDTLQLSFPMRLLQEQLRGWEIIGVTKEAYTELVFEMQTHKMQYCLDNGSTIHLTYYNNYYGQGPNLFIRFSLPKVLHGSNLVLAPSLEQAVRYLAFQLNSIPDLPELDPWEATVSELHVCCNFPVGDLLPYYLSVLRNSQYPRRKTNGFLGTGVMYPSTLSTCEFYDKGIESNNPAAQGLLRQEASLRSKAIRKAVKNYAGEEKDPTLRDVTECLMHFILMRDQKALGILDRSIGTADMARKILCDVYGPTRGMRLYGHLEARRELGTKEQLAREIRISPRAIQQAFKLIGEAGIAPELIDADVQLPPLTLPQPRR